MAAIAAASSNDSGSVAFEDATAPGGREIVLQHRPGAPGHLLVGGAEPGHDGHHHRQALAHELAQRRLELLLDHGRRGERILSQQAHQQVRLFDAHAHLVLEPLALTHPLNVPEDVEAAEFELLDQTNRALPVQVGVRVERPRPFDHDSRAVSGFGGSGGHETDDTFGPGARRTCVLHR